MDITIFDYMNSSRAQHVKSRNGRSLYSKMRIISERICSHAASGLQEFLPLQIDQHSFAALSFSCKRNLVIILRVQELGENRGNKILYLEAFINVNQILAFLLGFQ